MNKEEDQSTGSSAENGRDQAIDELLAYENNPFDPDKKQAQDIMRIFFEQNVSILPVVSRKNVLLGIITKSALTAAMSDIDNFTSVKIDRFITDLASSMDFDSLIPHITGQKDFAVINIFGELVGRWSRVELLEATENVLRGKSVQEEIEGDKNDQTIEWMIYMILEHIPRALYALNGDGKTIFYNGYFEELALEKLETSDLDVMLLETLFQSSEENDFFENSENGDYYFYNRTLDLYYEKVPMKNDGLTLGYLIYCAKNLEQMNALSQEGRSFQTGLLTERIDAFERATLVDELKKQGGDASKASAVLGLTKASLQKKIKKHDIKLDS